MDPPLSWLPLSICSHSDDQILGIFTWNTFSFIPLFFFFWGGGGHAHDSLVHALYVNFVRGCSLFKSLKGTQSTPTIFRHLYNSSFWAEAFNNLHRSLWLTSRAALSSSSGDVKSLWWWEWRYIVFFLWAFLPHWSWEGVLWFPLHSFAFIHTILTVAERFFLPSSFQNFRDIFVYSSGAQILRNKPWAGEVSFRTLFSQFIGSQHSLFGHKLSPSMNWGKMEREQGKPYLLW